MELDHDFTVAADADAAWPVLLDVERMHPLVPGAVYESGADGEYHGRLRIKFGPTTVTYRGTVRIAVVDDLTRTAILEITAREARGQGTVSGSLQATVLPSASSARVVLHTKLAFTGGRAASLSEHLVHDTGAKLLTRFSTNLNALLTSPAKPEPPAVNRSRSTPRNGTARSSRPGPLGDGNRHRRSRPRGTHHDRRRRTRTGRSSRPGPLGDGTRHRRNHPRRAHHDRHRTTRAARSTRLFSCGDRDR